MPSEADKVRAKAYVDANWKRGVTTNDIKSLIGCSSYHALKLADSGAYDAVKVGSSYVMVPRGTPDKEVDVVKTQMRARTKALREKRAKMRTRQFPIRLRVREDADVIARLEAVPNMTDYLRRLVRIDIAKAKQDA